MRTTKLRFMLRVPGTMHYAYIKPTAEIPNVMSVRKPISVLFKNSPLFDRYVVVGEAYNSRGHIVQTKSQREIIPLPDIYLCDYTFCREVLNALEAHLEIIGRG